jgi:hypothetical protein
VGIGAIMAAYRAKTGGVIRIYLPARDQCLSASCKAKGALGHSAFREPVREGAARGRATIPVLVPPLRDGCAMVRPRMFKRFGFLVPFAAIRRRSRTPLAHAVCGRFKERARQDSNL